MRGKSVIRRTAAVLAAVLVVAACGGGAVTPSASASANPSPSPWHAPSYALWQPSQSIGPSDSYAPSASQSATAGSSIGPLEFAIARGSAPLANPAADFGAAAADRINDFGFDLLRKMDTKSNLCASPTSVALALAMVRAGAAGTTATQMDQVLRSFGAPGQSSEIVALLEQLSSQTIYGDADGWPLEPGSTPDPANPDPIIELRVANQAFAEKRMALKPGYLDSLSSSFGAGVGLLDFMNDPETARLVINKWASDNTHGRIPNVLQEGDLDEFTRIALANAIYLKAAWLAPFDPDETKPRPFTTADGSTVSVPTMASSRQMSYAAGAGYRAVNLPLTGWSLEMTIVVPDNMASFTSSLTNARFDAIVEALSTYDVDLYLPRFSVETRTDLAKLLSSMGMTYLFDPGRADLTGITEDPIAMPLYITKVIHQANIDVLEDGVTAAAVTVAVGGKGSAGPGNPPPHVVLKVDKPFLYFVRDAGSGAVLFMGRVNNPALGS
jgi:serpin B